MITCSVSERVMNTKALQTLEFNKIIDKLCACAGSSLGRERCAALKPITDIEEINTLQEETQAALSRIYAKGSLSFSGIPDIRASIKRLEIHACLGAGELLHVGSVLTATARIKSYGISDEDREDDCLSERFRLLEPLTRECNEIVRCIISEEEVADDASAGLKNVRRQIKITNDKVRDQLGSILNNKDNQSLLQDNLITMRDGRYCIPIKSEFKNKFPGMIHDQSASGSTSFIEPMAVVKLNNELRELAIKEQEEIKKVLETLSAMLYQETENLAYDMETITEFDFIFARGSLAKEMQASRPVFNERGYLNIKKGRHPLIEKAKVVPIDIYLGDAFTMLIITGPNTGGKTVSLKTVGLFTLMGQAGLHIPAFDGSQLAVFDDVYADIGDEQSIEQSLSTFSSHMTNTVSILKKADEKSLVLFDELGAGTDPVEGAALAMSILTGLHNRDIRVMATTHYSELKSFALTTPGVCNACCEFSVETLSPTYRLLIGIPGKSNAFAISRKLGLSQEYIDMAESFIGTREKSLEDIITGLDNSRHDLEEKNRRADEALAEAERLRKKLEDKNDRIDTNRDKIIARANEEAGRILAEAKEFADETIRKINKISDSTASLRELEAERTALREKLTDAEKKNSIAVKPGRNGKIESPDSIKVGDSVRVLSLNVVGKVATLPNQKGDLTVIMGALRSTVNVKDLEWAPEVVKEKEKPGKTGIGTIRMSKSADISMECNVIGMRVDEALPVVEKYLDDAYLANLPQVSIIHGRGTGALKDAVHNFLKRQKYVESYRFGTFHEGDRGVTIVVFKQNT